MRRNELVLGVSDQVLHKFVCTVIEDKRLEILVLSRILYYLFSDNKDDDQLCSNPAVQ